jgi:hypothetical protein
MSSKSGSSKTAAAPPGRHNAEPAYDMFDSLRRTRSKAKQLRQTSQSSADDQLQHSGPRDDE